MINAWDTVCIIIQWTGSHSSPYNSIRSPRLPQGSIIETVSSHTYTSSITASHGTPQGTEYLAALEIGSGVGD